MFEVLYHPFPDSLRANPEAHAVLVFSSHKGQRILIQGVAQVEEAKKVQQGWFEVTGEILNVSPSLEYTRLMLRSIKETWQQSEYDQRRQRNRLLRATRNNFGADFGRTDFSEPGRGGSGIDGYW